MKTTKTMKDWKKIYYPVPASGAKKMTMLESVNHSLRKWRGLTKKIQKEFGMVPEKDNASPQGVYYGIMKIGRSWFHINDVTCSLCQKYSEDYFDFGNCGNCPLLHVRGTECFNKRNDEKDSPFAEFVHHGNPNPMLKWLRAAKKYAEKVKK